MDKLFYHTKPQDDPCGKGKRMTICCLVDNNKMSFGLTKTHHKDVKIFKKAKGRLIAEGRALVKPQFAVPTPPTKKEIRELFKEICKELKQSVLRSEKEIQLLVKCKTKTSL
jgi:hypothetical protein